jgi:Cu/Ag efflux pump CusA
LFLAIIRHFPGRFAGIAGAVIWLIFGVVPIAVLGNTWELFLKGIPLAITIVIAIISAALCGYELAKLLKSNQMEEYSYAFS